MQVVRDFTKQTVNEQVAFAIAGIAKVFVGEIVEEGTIVKGTAGYFAYKRSISLHSGLDFMVQLKETGPLKPKHIREAARRLKLASNPKPSKAASGFLWIKILNMKSDSSNIWIRLPEINFHLKVLLNLCLA